MNKLFYTIILTFAFTTLLVAQEMLTKEKAIELTLENNLNIKVAKNNKTQAKNSADILNSGYLPLVSLNSNNNIDLLDSEGELAGGMKGSANGVKTERYNAFVNLNYTLFDGLGRYYNYKKFKEIYNQSELAVRQTIENTILQLFSVYYEVARLTEKAHTLAQVLNISRERLKRANYQFEFGQNTGLNVLNAEVDVNTDSINLLNAQQLLRNTKRDLNLIMNQDLELIFKVDTIVKFIPGLDMEVMYKDATSNNVQILLLEKEVSIASYSLKISKSGFLPTIGLLGSYGWNESKNDNPLAFSIQNSSIGISGGLSLSWNVFDGGKSITNTKNAIISYQNQQLLKRQVELEIERDIKNAWDIYQNALYVLAVQEKSMQTNQNNFQRTRERYRIGQITSIEFRQAQLNLLNAKLAKSQAKYNAKLSELKMLQVSGQLMNVEF